MRQRILSYDFSELFLQIYMQKQTSKTESYTEYATEKKHLPYGIRE